MKSSHALCAYFECCSCCSFPSLAAGSRWPRLRPSCQCVSPFTMVLHQVGFKSRPRLRLFIPIAIGPKQPRAFFYSKEEKERRKKAAEIRRGGSGGAGEKEPHKLPELFGRQTHNPAWKKLERGGGLLNVLVRQTEPEGPSKGSRSVERRSEVVQTGVRAKRAKGGRR